ncbi:hypothetical protein [Chryseobacterium sp. GM_Chr_2]|uniref:hypothetical protein n=1 Tax=unclassified Chryseobacterium TaxID=2593645 RepID=UPI00320B44ED
MAKAEVQKTIELLAEKGVNVAEIEAQTKTTDDKISELDKKLEELPDTKSNLIVKYKKEKNEKLKQNQNIDNVKERLDENLRLFKIINKSELNNYNGISHQARSQSNLRLNYDEIKNNTGQKRR